MISYPLYNTENFLKYFDKRFKSESPKTALDYFPLMWDDIVGEDYSVYQQKLDLIDRLNQNKYYFTVTELILPPLPSNVLTFGPSGRIPIPFLCNYPQINVIPFNERKFRTWFAGTINFNRGMLCETCLVDLNNHDTDSYFRMLSNTQFALCPEGSDSLTYRLSEAIHCGCIPVYISNSHVLPFSEIIPYEEFCIIINWSQLSDLSSIISKFDIVKALDALSKYRNQFTYESTYEYIIKRLQ